VLLIRVDANVAIATGHVMRCLALAQAWQDAGGRAVFAMADSTSAVDWQLRTAGIETIRIDAISGSAADATCTADLARKCNPDWIVADGYHFSSDYQRTLKRTGLRLLFLDDNGHAQHYSADLVLNQNLHASESLYRNCESYTRLLLGPSYAMLRREFRGWSEWHRVVPVVGRKVLVTFGGSDPDNVTLRVLDALQQVRIEGLEVTVVVGGSNPHLASLEQAAAKLAHPVRLVGNATNMPDLMAWADLAIAGAGATCWEMCLLGLPALLIDLAPNQLQIAQRLDTSGVGLHIGTSRDFSPQTIASKLEAVLGSVDHRERMSQLGRQLVDGMGAFRVISSLRSDGPRQPNSRIM
jgi:UDP-2,4-diacetamido-2,4,6-trideoxy-beta-L-altropyranose hydrolase